MTRQCAWCECYLGCSKPGTLVTHGICDSCAEQLRHSLPHLTRHATPRWEGILLSTKARLGKVFHLR